MNDQYIKKDLKWLIVGLIVVELPRFFISTDHYANEIQIASASPIIFLCVRLERLIKHYLSHKHKG